MTQRRSWLAAAIALVVITALFAGSSLRKKRLDSELLEAAQRKDSDTLVSLLQVGADPNVRTAGGHAVLHQAEASADADAIALLIQHGADVNALDPAGRNCLQRAASRGDLRMVEVLLDQGADLAAADHRGKTALCLAVSSGKVEVARTLLRAGADPNTMDAQGLSPLSIAAQKRHWEMLELLLASGAKLDRSDGATDPLILALSAPGRDREREAIRENRRVSAEEEVRRLSDLVVHFVQLGANAGAMDSAGRTLLDLAPGQLDGRAVDVLHLKGASASQASQLLAGVWLGRLNEVRRALNAGADAGSRDVQGQTALWLAVKGRREEIAALLLQKGADANQQPSVLEAAISDGSIELVRLLLRHGASPTGSRANQGRPLLVAVQRGGLEATRLLLKAGAGVNRRDAGGETPLMAAAFRGEAETVRLLLDAGADMNVVTHVGDSALARACRSGSTEMVRMLLERGADPRPGGRSPVDTTGSSVVYSARARAARPGIIALLRRYERLDSGKR